MAQTPQGDASCAEPDRDAQLSRYPVEQGATARAEHYASARGDGGASENVRRPPCYNKDDLTSARIDLRRRRS